MAQWGYGLSVMECKTCEQLDDNIIPPEAVRPIKLDMDIARVTGVLLFAYAVTNDKYITSIKWVDGEMMIVYFSHYVGDVPNDPGTFPEAVGSNN